MHDIQLLLVILGALAIAAVARQRGWSAPLTLVAVGLGVSYFPGMPEFAIQPQLVLTVLLPPLLYSAALDSSYLGFRANLRPITLLAVALVLVTTVAIGYVAHLLIPTLPLTSALVLGAVIAPTDAVAAVAIGRRLGLPRRVMTVLSGESLVNDATALTAFKVTVALALTSSASWGEGIRLFLVTSAFGVLIGLAIGFIVHAVRIRLRDAALESAVGLVVPFAAYLLAEAATVSGVLAVVTAGFYLGHHAPRAGYATRLQETAVWRALDVLLESLVFALIGLNFRYVLHQVTMNGYHLANLWWPIIGVLVATIVIRVVWVFPATYLPRKLSRRLRRRDPAPPWPHVAVVAWSGMRGVVSLAAAAAVPVAVPDSDLVPLLAFTVTVGTLLVQGTTLPWLIRRLRVRGDEAYTDALAEAQTAHQATAAALNRLDELVTSDEATTPDHVVDRLRTLARGRGNAAWERLGRQDLPSPAATFRRLRLEMLAAERAVYVAARDAGEIDDEVLRRVLRELDLEEARLVARD